MAAPLKISQPTKKELERVFGTQPPRLNERVLIRSFNTEEGFIARTIRNHCDTVQKCGLIPEIVVTNIQTIELYAARRRPRNKHD